MTTEDRKNLEDKVWNATSEGYRSMYLGERGVLMWRRGTTIVALSTLSDDELKEHASKVCR